jgi:hypothetical protein
MAEGDGDFLENVFEPDNILIEPGFQRFSEKRFRNVKEVRDAGLNGYIHPCSVIEVLKGIGSIGMNRSAQGSKAIFFAWLEFGDFKST